MKFLVAILLSLVAVVAFGETKTVRNVTGVGTTFDEAKNNGFSVAIEKAVGSVLLVDKELRNDKLVRNDILSHSAGYVDDYRIISRRESPGQVTLVMDVDVKHSRIAERMLNRGVTENKLNGDRLATQYRTYLNERGTGDAVLNNLLKAFPNRAMNIQHGRIDMKLDRNRNAVIVVPIEISWDVRYLNAMNEAFALLQDGSAGHTYNVLCRCYPTSERFTLFNNGKTEYQFNDSVRANQIRENLSQRVMIHAQVKDNTGKAIYSSCHFSTHTFTGLTSSGVYTIWGNNIGKTFIELPIEPNSEFSRNLHFAEKVELSLKADTCEN